MEKLVSTTILLSFENGGRLSESFIYDEITPSAVIGALLVVCQSHGLPVKAWEVSLSSHPLPQVGTTPPDLSYMSGLLIEAGCTFFTVDFIQGAQHIGPVSYKSTDEYILDKKRSFFGSHTGPIHTQAQEVTRQPYAVPLAVEEMGEAIKRPLSEMRRGNLIEVSSRFPTTPAPSSKLKM